jgi:pyruvate dehydrogenase E2 component (dihydrolipoamide acetyltransferase)
MADKVIMPQLGESIAEGTIVKWLKKPGDDVKKDEDLLVISTDKVEAEIPAPSTGVLLSIDVPEGTTVAVGTTLGFVGAKGETASAGPAPAKPAAAPAAATPAPTPSAPSAAPRPETPAASMSAAVSANVVEERQSPSTSAGKFVSPLVRRIANEHRIAEGELDRIAGTGQNGRVTKNDLLKYVEGKKGGNGQTPQAAQQQARAPSPARPQVSFPEGAREVVKPASSMRKVIMQNMVASKQTSAHVHTFFEVDWTKIDKVRRQHKDRFKEEEGVGLTYTVFLTAAVCQVLKRHPYINAEIRGNDVVFKKDVHLGMAVAIEEPEPGLMVPVVRNADQMNLRGIAHAITDLAGRVRARKIKPDELSGGTFTITNPGNAGAVIGTPVINQPQVAILGVGNISKQPVVVEIDGADAIGIRTMGWLSLGFDHRLIDGATADAFMADLKRTLETWDQAP